MQNLAVSSRQQTVLKSYQWQHYLAKEREYQQRHTQPLWLRDILRVLATRMMKKG